MVLKNAVAAALCTGLLMSGGTALADEYRAGEFLGLDLSQAVLSPKRLGPETQFAPVPDRGETDPQAGENGTRGGVEGSRAQAANCAGARREAARRRPHQAGATPRQPARRTGARHADPDLAVQIRRHLRLAAIGAFAVVVHRRALRPRSFPRFSLMTLPVTAMLSQGLTMMTPWSARHKLTSKSAVSSRPRLLDYRFRLARPAFVLGEPMAAVAVKAAKIGASLLCSGAIVGTAVSVANFFSPDSGIAGTPGAILVIASTVILLALGLIMRGGVIRGRGFRVFVAAAALFDIVGTAFAGYLLNSETLVVAMLVSLAGWFIHLFESRPAPG